MSLEGVVFTTKYSNGMFSYKHIVQTNGTKKSYVEMKIKIGEMRLLSPISDPRIFFRGYENKDKDIPLMHLSRKGCYHYDFMDEDFEICLFNKYLSVEFRSKTGGWSSVDLRVRRTEKISEKMRDFTDHVRELLKLIDVEQAQ